ncbi:hypothetical protein SISNIDRAFT_488863 [Sistotremastrum niveocremeum HHB9708]|uniref:Nascent polypeptide-associated complex subunit alpha-like UBA domain-containing protein n=2 Tax=Sistotremastraceae TaxID=3402574 RepID=A0A164QVS9_9AGAM|nr:hypothetical protein SISNIDRAFT_488863 [Sistotremastrum niveocremeum HHB9708]KZT39242.1 hypothetical protein SISSUDRAFT_1061304 [Sistotremastrum suecicum HHB10207 ss-3]
MFLSNGRPEPEVIMNFQDGMAYSKNKMDEAFRSGVFDKPLPHKKDPNSWKKEDVDLIVAELEVPRHVAERALADNGADLKAALQYLITPRPSS